MITTVLKVKKNQHLLGSTLKIICFLCLLTINNNMNFKKIFLESLKNNKINIDAIEQIESGGNPKAIGKAGERGAIQILNKKTWDYIVKDMGQEYDWDKHWTHRAINKSIGDHYINNIIPRYLRAYKIPDTIETRIAAYNWGIGGLKKAYTSSKEQWLSKAPNITVNYINKYKKLAGIQGVTPKQPIAQTPTQTLVPKKPTTPRVHIVKSGDTISGIANLYKVRIEDLKKLNPEITNINKIGVGNKIKIA